MNFKKFELKNKRNISLSSYLTLVEVVGTTFSSIQFDRVILTNKLGSDVTMHERDFNLLRI